MNFTKEELVQFYQILTMVAEDVFNQKAKAEEVLRTRQATIATVDAGRRVATVYFGNDTENKSSEYYNATNQALAVGDRVYIVHMYGSEAQGWILFKQ